MDRLAGFLERRRWIVLAAWLLLLLAALPFAAKQTDHLTSGGFEVPGSQSQVVRENVTRFEGAQRDQLAAVLARRAGASTADVRAEVDRVARIAAELPHVELMGAIIVVAISILAAVTLLPVLMSVLGRRAYTRGRLAVIASVLWRLVRTRRRRPGSTVANGRRVGFWERWTAGVTRRPRVSALATAAVLLTLAIPALSLDFGNGALRQFPEGNETRVGAELAAQRTGAGATGPVQAIAELDNGRDLTDATGDTQRSVAEGLRASAGTISSAALIMVAVFGVFAGTGTPSIKEIGVGMSVAIALDATLVRLILVPATMEIMGRWNWWLPKRVDRVLPHAGFEGRSRREPALELGS